jgi:hypothetical protein
MNAAERLAHAAALDPNLSDDAYSMLVRVLRRQNPLTGEPERAPVGHASKVLPAPPNGDIRWSITTLAAHLCVPPAAVDAEIITDPDGDSDDFYGIRLHHSYENAAGEDRGDCWLTTQAADRIASALPAGLLARRIAAGDPQDAHLAPDLVWALARHIVDYSGGA